MSKRFISNKHEKWLAIGMVIGASLFAFISTELVLKLFFPFPRPATIGHTVSVNARLYGWGFSPGEQILLGNPDTGEPYYSTANNHGWRDRDRTFANADKKFRILILGDSVTFGPIVSDDNMYTRILENTLQSAGYNAEVINISYGGWGTDQELEALQQEGVRYKPNLIVLQFTTNDLSNNVFYLDEASRHLKPTFYSLDDTGNLVRSANPYFSLDNKRSAKDRVKQSIFLSEIGKRLYRRYVMLHTAEIPTQTKYKVIAKKLAQLSFFLQLPPHHPFLQSLKTLADQQVDKKPLEKIIASYNLELQTEMILRILEDRWFNYTSWTPSDLMPTMPDLDSVEWKLYFKLVEEADTISRHHGATLLLFTENDLGMYEWETYWFRVIDNEEHRKNYLAPNEIIREFALRHGIGFIAQQRKYVRCRNDPHPSALGNQAMADDIFDYLMAHHWHELVAFKK